MTPLDLGLAAIGRLAAAVEARTGPGRRFWAVVLGLVVVSAVPTYLIGSSQRPTDLTFEDVRFKRIPAMTSWVRMEGDLRPMARSAGSLYQLHDLRDPALYVIVIATKPLSTGPAVVTGRLSPAQATRGNIGSIEADVPAVPKQNEPFALILLPAALAGVILLGRRIGYPIVRRERSKLLHAPPLSPGERLDARWSGRIRSEMVPEAEARDCRVAVEREPEVHVVSVDDGTAEHEVRVRRAVPVTMLRVCGTGGCRRGVAIHAQAADLTLVFEHPHDRDRFVTTLG